jgi:glycosyltransferase involved in cell wall biosynthesis
VKILRVHDHYLQPGGENQAELAERRLLERAGHELVVYERHNREIEEMGLLGRAMLPVRTVWARDSLRDLSALVQRERPDLAHFTNTFPLISPLAYDACRSAGVPVVQSLHNYRLLCPAGTLLRHGRPCEECVEHTLWRGVRHGCYRDSRAATAVVAAMLALHRRRGTFAERVDAYVALTDFARRKFVEGGLPEARIFVKPNFVEDPGPRPEPEDYALFVGRLAPEKGPFTLLHAWEELGDRLPLRVAGDGPLRERLEAESARAGLTNVRFLGWLPRSEVLDQIRRARFLVFQSECYENFPLTIAEAFACGTPVLAPRLGAMAEIVTDRRTGLLFEPRDPRDLADKALFAWRNPKPLEDLGRAARGEYEAHYTPERNLEQLLEIYTRAAQRAADERRKRARPLRGAAGAR